ncbi:MAG TPA: prepilin-type N-terminal cleavage/methylation domain-containing protein [Planctomycetota bacterium]
MPARVRSAGRNGFSLIEVMAAVMLLAVSLTLLLQLRNDSISRAMDARNLSIAARLANQLLHRIEAARVSDLFDGYQGDFSDYDLPDFRYVIGIGDGSAFATGAGSSLSESEFAWRRQQQEQSEQDKEDDVATENTRVFLTVAYPSSRSANEENEFVLESLVPTWAVEQDWEAWEELWAGNLPLDVK